MSGSSRYVLVSQRFPPEKGGNASRIHDLAVHLADDATSVTVLAPPPCYPPGNFERTWERERTERVEGVVVRRLWSWQPARENPGLVRRLPYYLIFAVHAALWLALNLRRYDAVVTSTPPITTGVPGLVARALGTPWVVDVRDLWIENSVALGYVAADSPLVRASRWFQRLVLHTADRITVTTRTLGEEVADTYGASLASKVRHVPNGVDTDQFAPRATTPSADGGAARQTVVYTGNVGSAQALEPCIRAMERFSPDDVALRIVGDGDERSRLRRLTRDLGLDDRVEFVGLVDREEVPAVLEEAAVGLAPLRDTDELAYAVPTKTYEYLACEVPVLATGSGEISRFVADSGGGVCVDPDPDAIASALAELLDDRARRERMATAGRRHVVDEYDREGIADRLRAELTDLCSDDRRSAAG